MNYGYLDNWHAVMHYFWHLLAPWCAANIGPYSIKKVDKKILKEKMWRELRIDTLCFEALGVFLPTPRKTCSQGLSHCWFLLPIYCWRLFLITNYFVVQHGSLSLSAELSSAHWVSNEIPAYCHICSCIKMLKEYPETCIARTFGSWRQAMGYCMCGLWQRKIATQCLKVGGRGGGKRQSNLIWLSLVLRSGFFGT